MWDISKLYVSACSNSVQLVPLHPIVISILFHHIKLKECINEVDKLEEVRINSEQETLAAKEEEKLKGLNPVRHPVIAVPVQENKKRKLRNAAKEECLDSYFVSKNKIA